MDDQPPKAIRLELLQKQRALTLNTAFVLKSQTLVFKRQGFHEEAVASAKEQASWERKLAGWDEEIKAVEVEPDEPAA